MSERSELMEHLTAFGVPLESGGLRIAVKPNLTWYQPRPGVTTSVELLRFVVIELASRGNQVSIVESNGGYGTFSAWQAFEGHGLLEWPEGLPISVINLSEEPTLQVRAGGILVDMPKMLLNEVDLLVNMPVPKVHVLTRYTGAVKNHWGLIPSDMRLRRHSRLPHIINDLLDVLPREIVVMDGTYFLNKSGPMEGHPVSKDIIILSDHPVVADIVALRVMGWEAPDVPHLRYVAGRRGISSAHIRGDLPARANDRFTLRRTFWNWIALAGFRSRFLTWLGYESPLAGPFHAVKVAAERIFSRKAAPKPDV